MANVDDLSFYRPSQEFRPRRYIEAGTTQSYVAGGRATITVPSGNLVAVVFEIQGTVTAVGGVAAGRGIVESVGRVSINSRRNGLLGILLGEEIYNLGMQFFPEATRKDETEAAGGTAGFQAMLPVYSTPDDLLRLAVEFGALADFHTTATAYTGVVRVTGIYESSAPTFLQYYRHFDIGAIAISGTFQVIPDIVRDAKNVELMAFYIESYTAAVDVTTEDAFDRLELRHNTESLLDVQFRTLQTIDHAYHQKVSALVTLAGRAYLAGTYLAEVTPIVNNEATVLTLTNGAVATVAGTQGVFVYRSLLEARAPEVVVQ